MQRLQRAAPLKVSVYLQQIAAAQQSVPGLRPVPPSAPREYLNSAILRTYHRGPQKT
jgi:hypothetical protein